MYSNDLIQQKIVATLKPEWCLKYLFIFYNMLVVRLTVNSLPTGLTVYFYVTVMSLKYVDICEDRLWKPNPNRILNCHSIFF